MKIMEQETAILKPNKLHINNLLMNHDLTDYRMLLIR